MKTLAALTIAALALAGCSDDGPVEDSDSKFFPQKASDWQTVPGPYGVPVHCFAYDGEQQTSITCMEINNG